MGSLGKEAHCPTGGSPEHLARLGPTEPGVGRVSVPLALCDATESELSGSADPALVLRPNRGCLGDPPHWPSGLCVPSFFVGLMRILERGGPLACTQLMLLVGMLLRHLAWISAKGGGQPRSPFYIDPACRPTAVQAQFGCIRSPPVQGKYGRRTNGFFEHQWAGLVVGVLSHVSFLFTQIVVCAQASVFAPRLCFLACLPLRASHVWRVRRWPVRATRCSRAERDFAAKQEHRARQQLPKTAPYRAPDTPQLRPHHRLRPRRGHRWESRLVVRCRFRVQGARAIRCSLQARARAHARSLPRLRRPAHLRTGAPVSALAGAQRPRMCPPHVHRLCVFVSAFVRTYMQVELQRQDPFRPDRAAKAAHVAHTHTHTFRVSSAW